MSDEVTELKAKLAAVERERDLLAFMPALDTAIAAAGVAPKFRLAARALFLASSKLELVEGETLYGGTPLAVAVGAWAASGEGLPFVASAETSTARGAKRTMASKKRSEMSGAEKGEFIGAHGLAAQETPPCLTDLLESLNASRLLPNRGRTAGRQFARLSMLT